MCDMTLDERLQYILDGHMDAEMDKYILNILRQQNNIDRYITKLRNLITSQDVFDCLLTKTIKRQIKFHKLCNERRILPKASPLLYIFFQLARIDGVEVTEDDNYFFDNGNELYGYKFITISGQGSYNKIINPLGEIIYVDG